MAQKKNNQDIVNSIAEIAGVTKVQAAKFLQSLTDTIIEGLQTDGNVEIDGMGTLGTVKMAGRESVNVANGERIVIDAFTKFTFSPAFKTIFQESRNEAKDEKQEEDGKPAEDVPVAEDDNEVKEELPKDENSSNETADEGTDEQEDTMVDDLPPVREKPVDAFSGIDVLISTPESLEDVRQRLTDAKLKEVELAEKMNNAKMALVLAQKAFDEVKAQLETARDEVKTMEVNVENVENNRKAVIDNENEKDPLAGGEDSDKSQNKNTENKKKWFRAGDDSEEATETISDGKKRRRWIMGSVAAACAVIALMCILFCGKQQTAGSNQGQDTAALQKDGNGNSDSDFEKKQIQNRRQTGSGGQTVTEKSTKDHEGGSGVNTQLEKTENVSLHKTENNLNGKNLIRVDTVVFDGTEYLEHIVTKHYGEHDMVYRVLEFNRKAGQLKDYRHIPKGTKILMPHYE